MTLKKLTIDELVRLKHLAQRLFKYAKAHRENDKIMLYAAAIRGISAEQKERE
jgi:hypothetical protein